LISDGAPPPARGAYSTPHGKVEVKRKGREGEDKECEERGGLSPLQLRLWIPQ